MPDERVLESVEWATDEGYRGYDFHLVRFGSQAAGQKNSSAPLRPMLRYKFLEGVLEPVPPGKTTFSLNLPELAKYGIELDAQEGIITLTAAAPATVIRNVIVTATVTHELGTQSTRIRVHLHDKLTKAYLVPLPRLLLRIGTQARCSVLADFEDKTVGDLSYDPDLAWDVVSGPISISSNDGDIGFRGVGFMVAMGGNPGDIGQIKATLPSRLGGTPGVPATAEGSVKLLPRWSDLPVVPPFSDPYEATFITGPGTAIRNEKDVRNVLILPDGFETGQRALFEELADAMAMHGLSTSRAYRPFDLVNERINYYRLWVAPDVNHLESISELPSFYSVQERGYLLPFPHPPNSAGISALGHLLFQVGLPAPDDVDDTTTLAAQMAVWATTYNATFVTFDGSLDAAKREDIFQHWKLLRSHGITAEVSTVFGLAGGERPRVDRPSYLPLIKGHEFRSTRREIHEFLKNIKSRGGGAPVNIGADLWGCPPPPPPPDPPPPLSKDVNLVCFLCLGPRMLGTSFAMPDSLDDAHDRRTQIAVVVTDQNQPKFAVTTFGQNFKGILADIPKRRRVGNSILVPRAALGTLAHELGHQFNLGDEYAPSPHFIPESRKPELFEVYWNLQLFEEVDSDTVGEPKIEKKKIRWRWPRITKGGFMKTGLVKVPNTTDRFTVELVSGYAEMFKKGDKVRFRDPNLLRPISDPEFPDRFLFIFQDPPELFEIEKKDASNRELFTLKMLEPDPGQFALQNSSKAGDILYKPQLDADNKDVSIIHKRVLDHMGASGPLTRLFGDCSTVVGTGMGTQVPINLPPSLKPEPKKRKKIRNLIRIIGLYDGGHTFRCGVYHPTGQCKMRTASIPVLNGPDVIRSRAVPFCHVCQYMMVDVLDPRRHAELDASLIYPEFTDE
jgi:hypothetical protein